MSIQVMEKPASERQLAYIRRLQMEMGADSDGISDEISSAQASMLIGKLIAKGQKLSGVNGGKSINEPRLGMAMKECFRDWRKWDWDMLKNEQNKERFISQVITTYGLFTEVAERLSQNGHGIR